MVEKEIFRTELSRTIFEAKYKHDGCETWPQLSSQLAHEVCDGLLDKDDVDGIKRAITNMEFIPGGRYLYYAGRPNKFYNNCYLLRSEEDTREDWAELSWKAETCLTTGGGIGNDYSVYRGRGSPVRRTGGVASGPTSKAMMVNEIGRGVVQGAGRRSAIYGSLRWSHSDIYEWMAAKDWHLVKVPGTDKTLWDVKAVDPSFPAPLDMTNISVNYDTAWLEVFNRTGDVGDVFRQNIRQALKTGDPGFSFNFFGQEDETLRNACTEVTSMDDSDVCNLGSLNFSRITDPIRLAEVVELATKFLLCGTLKAQLPYEKIARIREKNRRLGLGVMGLHEWLLARSYRYEMVPELRTWLRIYRDISDHTSKVTAEKLNVSRPIANRAIAPTGTIGMLAGTTTGIEPVYAVAYKRRYLKGDARTWKYQYAVDSIAQALIERYDMAPERIESAVDLATDYERRIAFQADVQDYVDMGISSTINLPAYGTIGNNDDLVGPFGATLAKYASRLRGFTCYPDGARGGQPLSSVPYHEVKHKLGEEFDEHFESNDVCSITGGGYCGS
jgi:ribonucleoside-diphosphate reductase alpha chain